MLDWDEALPTLLISNWPADVADNLMDIVLILQCDIFEPHLQSSIKYHMVIILWDRQIDKACYAGILS